MSVSETLSQAVATLRKFHAEAGEVAGGQGLEAIIAGATLGVPRSTWIVPGRRERGAALLRGATADRLDAARPYRVVPAAESPALRALYAVGLAQSGDGALVFLGMGSTSYGSFAEALSLGASTGAPVRFVVSWYAGAGPFATPLAVAPSALAAAFGLRSVVVDGRDAEAVRAAVAEGPGLIEARIG